VVDPGWSACLDHYCAFGGDPVCFANHLKQTDKEKHLPTPFLSLIIPAHNEQARLPDTIEQVFEFADRQEYNMEVLVVENGSQDRTLSIAQEYAARYPQLKVLQNSYSGKGRAVQQGMLAAQGEFRFMCDVDLSMPVDEINQFLPPSLSGLDIAIASREAPGAVRYGEPYYRHLVGRIYNGMIRTIALPGLDDTQCGFKCFRNGVAEDLFKRQTMTGWSFDVEILFIARLLGYKVVEIPIHWHYNPHSKISVVRDSFKMGMDLLTIRLNALRGTYTRANAKI
jgi:dolichyl-phosphate beta-glucosyltransferase